MPRVEEPHHGVGDVALERLRARREEERVVLTPDGEQWRLAVAEILLKDRIQRDVASVITKEVELYFIGARSSEIEIVERVAVG